MPSKQSRTGSKRMQASSGVANARGGASAKSAKAGSTTRKSVSANSEKAVGTTRGRRGAAGSKTTRGPDADAVLERLTVAIPDPQCELDHRGPWQLLIATILSAQSTDRAVNEVTPELFRRWPNPAALAAAPALEVEDVIRRTGFFRNKAKSIRGASQRVVEDHGGEVPASMEALLKLPGVARKTANVVLGTGFRVSSGIVVDTHVMRLSGRLGLSKAEDPKAIEQDLCRTFPQATWIDLGHRILLHGRYVCVARAPKCERCCLNEVCPSSAGQPAGSWRERAAWECELVQSRGQSDASR